MPLTAADAAGAARLGIQGSSVQINNVTGSVSHEDLLVTVNRLIDAANLGFLQRTYPLGSLYFNATDGTNPSTLLGFGTWVAYATGRVPVGINASDTDFATAAQTGGQKTVQAHNHSITTNNDDYNDTGGAGSTGPSFSKNNDSPVGVTSTNSTIIGTTGTGATNMNPYIVVYIWKRTA